eukprot:COSAG02_NODE_572_length_20163_cov_9.875461_10_plen_319_part_00
MGKLLADAGLRVVFKRFTDFDEQQDYIRRAAVSQHHCLEDSLCRAMLLLPSDQARDLCSIHDVFECKHARVRIVLADSCVQIVANVHFHEDAALEVHRIDPLLAAGKCVLSEYSSDAELDALYKHEVVFASYDEFVPEAVRLLASATRRNALLSSARSQMWERHSGSYPQQLHDALEALPSTAESGSQPSENAWAKWASSATGRAQFSDAIVLVQDWANSHNASSGYDDKAENTSCSATAVECVITAPGKIGVRLEASSSQVRPQISAIVAGSQASKVEGLKVGMMLVAVQETKIGPGREQAMAAISAAGRPLRLLFQ